MDKFKLGVISQEWLKIRDLVMPISHHHSLVRVGGVKSIGNKSRQFSTELNIFEAEQLQIGNWVETRKNCLVANSVHTANTDMTRQDSFVLSVSAV